jgi:hypothetical protein
MCYKIPSLKEQNHCTKVAYAGINWRVGETEQVCIVVPALRLVHSRRCGLLATQKADYSLVFGLKSCVPTGRNCATILHMHQRSHRRPIPSCLGTQVLKSLGCPVPIAPKFTYKVRSGRKWDIGPWTHPNQK